MARHQDRQCIFTRQGILWYKLCRKNFRCSECPLAHTILDFSNFTHESPELNRLIQGMFQFAQNRSDQEEKTALGELLGGKDVSMGIHVPQDRYYHFSHIWLLPLSKRQAKLGFDDLSQRFLRTITHIEFSYEKERKALGWNLSCLGRKINIPCPYKGSILQINELLKLDPVRIHEDPYDRGWLMEIESEEDIEVGCLIPGTEAGAWMTLELERLHSMEQHNLGTVSMEGGKLINNPARWLPEREWRELVDLFIVQPALVKKHKSRQN